MGILDKPKKIDYKLKGQIPSLTTFEETYKTAYTHGLEVIYSLENVDLKTIRRIEEYQPSKENVLDTPVTHCPSPLYPANPQLEFDLGYDFKEWIAPLFLEEPIRMLGLSTQAESCLLEQGIRRISDLLAQNFKQNVFIKGMGQGHIDEIRQKLEKYVGGRSLQHAYTIDFRSLILGAATGLNFKKLSMLLKNYELADEIPLSLAEKIEVRSFDPSKEPQWQVEILSFFQQSSRKTDFNVQLEKIARVFLLPWIRSRGGIATQDEVEDRLVRIAEKPGLTPFYLNFIREIFTQGEFPFASFFCQPEPGLLCYSIRLGEQFAEVVEAAQCYFYKKGISYSLEELAHYLLREFCKQWKNYSLEFIQECLMRTRQFEVVRTQAGQLRIKMA